jgi:ADP-dependent NAD(P)H-hydrate dehydratase / NAD(P)H-hydrate epimerase
MKILTSEQIKLIDKYTIEHEPIASLDLMERASATFTEWFTQQWSPSLPVYIFCGPGNNGGDGLAVGRMLHERGYEVITHVVKLGGETSQDFDENLSRLKMQVHVGILEESTRLPNMPKEAIIIDAIFGSGLTRPAEGLAAKVIEHINAAEATRVAIDIPSGLYADKAPEEGAVIVNADYTYTFQVPKLSFLLPAYEKMAGEWLVGNIGLHPQVLEDAETSYYFVLRDFVQQLLKPRPKFSHKGVYGSALLIGGSWGKVGAITLTARACLRTGVGTATVYVPKGGYVPIQTAVPEAMALTDPHKKYITQAPAIGKFTAVGIGPGMGKEPKTVKAFAEILNRELSPMVLDADALNILSENPDLLEKLPKNSILTPHPKEFERLAGKADNDFDKLEKLKAFSKEHKVIVVLKGGHTATALPDGRVFFNSTGNAGMATGGTGDALTGIITSLVCQQYEPWEAAILGVYLHGLAGDLAAAHWSKPAMLAGDLIDHIGEAFKVLLK